MNVSPSAIVPAMIEEVLEGAETWMRWDGEVVVRDGRQMTPLKAIRRVTDHVIDHLAEFQARVARQEPLPDNWHHSAHTTAADRALFSEADLNEARERLHRLARLWQLIVEPIPDDVLDHSAPGQMTLRKLAAHTAESKVYADALGIINEHDRNPHIDGA
jgi:hypothetical protein